MKIVICGLAITSSWGNGHATTYRALARALHARGHRVCFFERDLEWYASNRDMPEPPFCCMRIYRRWPEVLPLLKRELADSDVAIVGSYFPDGIDAASLVLDSATAVKVFYDIDTPITLSKLRAGEEVYIRRDQIGGFDLYLSFTGGPTLTELETKFGARRAVPFYCSFDPERYRWSAPVSRFGCDLSYMGTYAADRQAKLEDLFCGAATQLPEKKFMVAGPQYPPDIRWPRNVGRTVHLEPKFHPLFYGSSRFTLNLTRKEMVAAGYSPSVRLFEAAGCGTAIISDTWPGLEAFFVPGKEILIAPSRDAVIEYLSELSPQETRALGLRAQERVLSEHSAERRAIQFENLVSGKVEAVRPMEVAAYRPTSLEINGQRPGP